MKLLFDITGDDVAMLSDTDLRSLVGLLCEAEFHKEGLPLSTVAWGGNQNASDGGLDVVVSYGNPKFSIDFVPRGFSGYQVKKSDLAPAQIFKEMKPGGKLRNSIKGLINNHGAYIIASGGSTSAIALERRIKAMRKAVSGYKNSKHLFVDFLDCSRLASWVRKHPSLVLWLRQKIGRPLKGWQPFGNWSASANPVDAYILDDGMRLHNAGNSDDKGLSSTSALIEFRSLLSRQGASVRLAGLSGVGKTRFAQALFENVGENSLNPRLVIYADMSDGPQPDPKSLAEELIFRGSNAILIVDNCPPNLHSRLTKSCKSAGSKINLLTIEYDVKDDIPEETDVYILEPSSNDVIEKLVQRRYPKIGFVNVRTITEVAGGNARVALALASTVKKGESISTLRDDELFIRLFQQRNSENDDLLKSAEVCSLVYSFDGATVDDSSELMFLAKLIGMEPRSLFRHISTLKQRKLVQSRGNWRAILPHAIANRLAKKALESIPVDRIVKAFELYGNRLLKSFSRRLSYLHHCTQAIDIASQWLRPDGLLGVTKGNLSDYGMSILTNIAPVAPSSTLDFFYYSAEANEKFASRENHDFYKIVGLLRSIAYDPATFYRSVKLICRFALTEKSEENNNSIRRELGGLFQLHLSGTHANVDQRSKVITDLLTSSISEEQALGLFLLGRALSSGTFTGIDHVFGARPRDYGWRPRTDQDIFDWYSVYIELCRTFAFKSGSLKAPVRKLLSNNFRALWRDAPGLRTLLDSVAREIRNDQFWDDGWVAVKSIFLYDSERLNEDALNQLKSLEMFLRPRDLIDRARTIALTTEHGIFDFDINYKKGEAGIGWQRMLEVAYEIGGLVAKELAVFDELVQELLSTSTNRLFSFGKGFGDNVITHQIMWERISSEISKIPQNKRQYSFALGFLAACSNKDQLVFSSIMDDLVENEIFSVVYPYVQSSLGLDPNGIKRIKRSLANDKFDIRNYDSIAYAHYTETVSEEEYVDLQECLLSKKGGQLIVVEGLYMRLSQKQGKTESLAEKLIRFGRKVLAEYNFYQDVTDRNDHQIALIVKECFKDNTIEFDETSRHLRESLKGYHFRYDYREVINSLASTQPFRFLDIFVGEA